MAVVFRTLSSLLIFDVIFIMTGGGPGNTTETLSYLDWKAFLVNNDFGMGGTITTNGEPGLGLELNPDLTADPETVRRVTRA